MRDYKPQSTRVTRFDRYVMIIMFTVSIGAVVYGLNYAISFWG